jgi:heat shock protein HslJ
VKKSFAVFAAASTLLLGACSTLEDAYNDRVDGSQSASRSYAASGDEPGWSLNITPSRVEFKGDYGQTVITAANMGVQTHGNAEIYANGRLRVQRTAQVCTSSMSGERFSDTVVVIADGKRMTGCGGEPLALASVDDSSWIIEKINGKPVISGKEAALTFSEGRISGTAGCNRLTGGYSQSGDKLSFQPIAMTRMACQPALMQQERAVLDALGNGVSIEHKGQRNMILHGADGATIEVARSL